MQLRDDAVVAGRVAAAREVGRYLKIYYMNMKTHRHTPTRHNFRLGCAKKFCPAFLMSIISVEEEAAAGLAVARFQLSYWPLFSTHAENMSNERRYKILVELHLY